jgi:CheY-like chemotaxis protein
LPWSLAYLIGLFFAGFLLVLGLHSTFSNLIGDLSEMSANEQARSFIGEEIIQSVQIIELAPHLDRLQTKQEQLSRLLRLREELREQGDFQRFVEQKRQISLHLKTLPPFFLRINENANRLFFESHQRLEQLKAQLAADRKAYIDIRSEPGVGVGTAFHFYTPLEPSVGAVLRPTPLAGSTALLLMEDELITQMLQRHIGSLGAGVLVSRSLSEAHRVLANGWGDIRLIIAGAAFRSILSCIPPKPGVEEPIRLAISERWIGAADGGGCQGADAMLKPPVTYTNVRETVELVRGRRMDAAAGVSGPRHAGTAYKVHVLVVEDNPVNQLVASGMLDALGYKVEIANNGAEALEEIRKRSFDIVLMDVEMPVMDGYSATREIRRWEKENGTRPVPVIAMTANAMSDDQARCIESGMDDHLAKPFSLDALAGLIKLWTPLAHHSS